MTDAFGLDDSDYEYINGRKILKEGRSLRVPLFAMDAMQRDVARSVSQLDALRAARDKAYADREADDQNAWRRDQDRDRSGFARDAWQNDALDPRSPRFNLDAARAARDEAYADLEREQQDAWRSGPCAWSEDARRNRK
jgi:hypothetical protein